MFSHLGRSVLTVLLTVPLAGHAQDLNSDFERFLSWFPGEYDNHEQVWQQGVDGIPEEDRHEWIHHLFVPVEAPAVGEHVYFVRQYNDNEYDKVYRQRLYRLSADTESGAVKLEIFSFLDEAKYAATDRDASLVAGISLDELKAYPGCEVYWQFEKDRFLGDVKEGACRYHSERLGKEIIISEALTLTDSEIWINDQAHDAEGNRIFGRDEPHKNRKVRRFTGWWLVTKAHLDPDGEAEGVHFVRNLDLHNEGDRAALITEDGIDTGYTLELARLTYQNTRTAILKLGLIENESGKTITYIWADPKAMRIGMNLRWMQAGLTSVDLEVETESDQSGS